MAQTRLRVVRTPERDSQQVSGTGGEVILRSIPPPRNTYYVPTFELCQGHHLWLGKDKAAIFSASSCCEVWLKRLPVINKEPCTYVCSPALKAIPFL